jgi:uncharacterized protein (DUF885 family)
MGAHEDLHDLFDRQWVQLMDDHPETATYVGWHEHHDRWTDHSTEAIEERRSRAGVWLDELGRIDRSALDDGDRRSADIFERLQRLDLDALEFPGELLPLDQLDGPQNDIPLILASMPTQNDEQLGDVLARLRGIPTMLGQVTELLRRGIAAGVTVPAVCLREIPAQLDAHLGDDPTQIPELAVLDGAPQAIVDEATAIVREHVQPAYRTLRDFVVDTYLPAARETIALSALPDGPEWYAERVRYHTTTDLTAREIHDIGLGEVERIVAAMDEVMAGTGFTGDRRAFADHLGSDPRFFFDSGEALLVSYRDIAKRIDPEITKLFGLLPRLPWGVIPVPPEQAASAPAAFYMPGSLALGRPGIFYANTYDLAARPSWNMESVCLHEAVPGHHFQISIAQELEGVPEFRKQSLGCTAYVEGWGLYCESLGPELGMYSDPYQRYGALDAELLRAIRLVTDTGMHALGWSREQAIAFFEDHSPMPKHDIVVEVDRYIVLPGQALAYKVGELKLQELRRRATERLAERFDIRAFHDEVLRNGALPLDLLDEYVEAWLGARC